MDADKMKEQVGHICDRVKHELLTIIISQMDSPDAVETSAPEWMTAIQLAQYWQLYNKDGEPTTSGILKWSKRPAEEYPLPHAYMGDLLRFRREDVDRWAVEEAERRRSESNRKKLRAAS